MRWPCWRPGSSSKRRWLATGLTAAGFALVLAWWFTLQPSNDRDWQPDVAVISTIIKPRSSFPMAPPGRSPSAQDVDLTRRQVGEEVVIRITEMLAISVEKPQ